MTIQEIAQRLVAHCEKENYEAAQKELYAEDAISIEPEAMGGYEKETKGLQNILRKGQQFTDSIEASYGTTISAPLIAGNAIAFTLKMDAKFKGRDRSTFEEICVYVVKDGKIISEQFFA
ncbi:nuclear transport factor 2 family protein [Chitinophaga qingshengii]|uniref:Nuclear transport factor 2 family protein n=1 Tax=Chitinophaga qingshengii TaxID=1569794 RepID=A0ABR7TFF3_9BACT|nr:nuclear transport factor 2 family protein [Chitinophaga qingshengii]MBC9929057.1 nuclear transport factor 2 family protein [Chitinophaga qingshengii]